MDLEGVFGTVALAIALACGTAADAPAAPLDSGQPTRARHDDTNTLGTWPIVTLPAPVADAPRHVPSGYMDDAVIEGSRLPKLKRVTVEPIIRVQPITAGPHLTAPTDESLQAITVLQAETADLLLDSMLSTQDLPSFEPDFLALTYQATRPVPGAEGTLGADLRGAIDPDDKQPLVLADEYGHIVIAPQADDERRHVLLQGGRIESAVLTVMEDGALLELDGAQLAVTDAAGVIRNGQLETHIHGSSAGLDLGPDAALNLAGGQVVLYFHRHGDEKGIHWGMRGKGDRREEFQQQINANRILAAVVFNGQFGEAEPQILYDGQYTYITIKPPVFDDPVHSSVVYGGAPIAEPATLGLLGLGALALLKRRR
jgi:hypothetical protein